MKVNWEQPKEAALIKRIHTMPYHKLRTGTKKDKNGRQLFTARLSNNYGRSFAWTWSDDPAGPNDSRFWPCRILTYRNQNLEWRLQVLLHDQLIEETDSRYEALLLSAWRAAEGVK